MPRSSRLYRDERVFRSTSNGYYDRAMPCGLKRFQRYRWSSFSHYATGERGVVEIESEWTA
ncbi:MAG TPA: hypothetical protein VN753_11355, partial [Terracidiphilus sp.]|nr:hypothetical protein [Terracidiphilus sp.]